ncbi:MAG: DUF4367 domain-containing protein [Lachnospiraceae bacterium]|nr:DUF4367 domain-containing protein [Lachnospiraceae bacterium]
MEREQGELHKKLVEELSVVSLPEDFASRVMQQAKKDRQFSKRTILVFAVNLFVILIPFCAVGMYIYESISVNQEVLPELLPMEVKNISYLSVETTDEFFFRTERIDYKEVEKELGIQLLEADGKTVEKDFVVQYLSDGGNWIRLSLKNYFKVNGRPIDWKIEIITSETQKEQGWDHEYLGYYQYIETVHINRTPIHLLQDTVAVSTLKIQSEKIAVFVYDGVRYTISGRISIDELKNILEELLQ